jgi:hypothetical protein
VLKFEVPISRHSILFGLVAAMGTEKGSRTVAEAIKDIEVEKIRGPGDASSAKLATFWEKQVIYILDLSVTLLLSEALKTPGHAMPILPFFTQTL